MLSLLNVAFEVIVLITISQPLYAIGGVAIAATITGLSFNRIN